MSDENTPLIATVRVGEPSHRYPHHTVRRICNFIFGTGLLALCVVFLIFAIDPTILPGSGRHLGGKSYGGFSISRTSSELNHEDVLEILFDTPSPVQAKEWSRYYTSGPHLAGQNLSQAEWTRDKWSGWGVPSEIVPYDVYLNYPVDHGLAMLSKKEDDQSEDASWTVEFKATLEEDVLDEDPTSGLKDRIPTFHGYSASGNVTGSFVWVNYGTYQDFEDLTSANVSLEGKIAIARYGGIFRGLKIRRAQDLGMIGVVLYSDPGDDGEVREDNGYEPYPKGPARNPSSVQRGSAQFLSQRPGDPSTPGYPSKPGVPRAPVDDATPSIPSVPISYAEALPILKALNGHGPKAEEFNQFWTRNLGLRYKGVEYNIGPSPDNLVINLHNKQDYVITPLWNVIGIVNGTIPNEVIVVGNHRDAWIAGGAGDPNSGSAVVNEVIRSVGAALDAGWKPLRTIVFASWDGEEYGLIGSTEWVEEYLPWLSQSAVAYLNVDVGVRSPNFLASAAPLLHRLIREVVAAIPSPNQTIPGQTVGDLWDGRIKPMGSGSDFTAFQDFAGVPSLDYGFGGYGLADPVYHYHSNYDSFSWMDKFGDPSFEYHQAMARILGRTLGELAGRPIIRFNATDYADALTSYVDQVASKLSRAMEASDEQSTLATDISNLSDDEIFSLRSRATRPTMKHHSSYSSLSASPSDLQKALTHLRFTLVQLRVKTEKIDATAAWADRTLEKGIPWYKPWIRIRLALALIRVNTAYRTFERYFIYPKGLDGRSWFKHVVFAPGLWTGYAGAVFPGLQESVDARDWGNGVRWAGIINQALKHADKGIGFLL